MNTHIDFAPHSVTARAKLKSMYKAANNNEYELALQEGLEALVELRLALNALKHLSDNRHQRD